MLVRADATGSALAGVATARALAAIAAEAAPRAATRWALRRSILSSCRVGEKMRSNLGTPPFSNSARQNTASVLETTDRRTGHVRSSGHGRAARSAEAQLCLASM